MASWLGERLKRLTTGGPRPVSLLRWRLDHFVALNVYSLATFAACRLAACLCSRGTAADAPVVGLDARCLERNLSGLERYVARLAEHLAAAEPRVRFRLYLRQPCLPPQGRLANLEEFSARPLRRLLRAQNQHLARREVSLFHVTWQDMFWYHNFPLLFARRSVLTIHDLINLNVPDYHPAWERTMYRWILRLACRWADRVIVDSQWTQDDLLRSVPGVAAWKIRVVSLAPGERFRSPPELARAREIAERYGLDGPYFFCLSKTYAHKNLGVLVEAFRRLVKEAGEEAPRLLIAGERYWEPTNEELRGALADPRLAKSVVWTGHVEDEDLPALYAGATAFVLPSRYEGFGLPILEAMASGTPVLAARATSLPEVGGDAALYFDPDDAEDLALHLGRLARDAELRRGLAALGREHAARFSWERTARETLAVYRELL